MTKTLDTLLERAQRNSVAIKNGRITEYDFGQVYKGDLQEQWAIEYHNQSNIVELRHWGTTLVEYNHVEQIVYKESMYAQSVSDRDALNWFFQTFHIDLHAHYYPSREEAEIHHNKDDVIYTTI